MGIALAARVAKVAPKRAPAKGPKATARSFGSPPPSSRRHKTTVTRVTPKKSGAKARRTVKTSAKRPARRVRTRKGATVAAAPAGK